MAQNKRNGFTLIGLLLILGMIAFLLGLLVPAIVRVREAAARTQCINNVKEICLASINCADTYKGRLAPTVGAFPTETQSSGTVFFYLLPFLEQDALFRKAEGYVSKNGTWSVPVRTFICPFDGSAPPGNLYKGWLSTSNYAANYLVFKQGGARFPASFRDGTSNTIMFSERYQICNGQPTAWGYPALYTWAPMFMYYNQGKFQTRPDQKNCDPALAQSTRAAGIPAGMGDGSVRFVRDTISPETWYHACTPDGGEPLGDDF